jgi:hypothetical protein
MAVAESAADELAGIAASFKTGALCAVAATTRAALALALGDGDAALRGGRQASQSWQELELPYEAARARFIVAEALVLNGAPDGAALEFRAALATFERLGAQRDAQVVADRIRCHGVGRADDGGESK